jgi:hypothetical protein
MAVVLLPHKRVSIQWWSIVTYGHPRRVSAMHVSRDKKKGYRHNGTQNRNCHAYWRQCAQSCEHDHIVQDKRALLERLLVERMSLRGMGRAVGVTCT